MKGRHVLSIALLSSLALGVFACSSIHNIRTTEATLGPNTDLTLTTMTYNIRVGGGIDSYGTSPHLLTSSKQKLERLSDAIKSVDPDVVALQEVGGLSQASFLARRLNLNFVYSSHGNRYFVDFGMAVLSKYKILSTRDHSIYGPGGSGYDPRIGLESVIDINGKSVTVLNVHYSNEARNYQAQVDATMDALKGLRAPIVLLGDFNRREWDREMKPLFDEMRDTCLEVSGETSRYVRSHGTGFGRIDYIFVDSQSFEVISVGLIPRDHWNASDHIGYFAKVRLRR